MPQPYELLIGTTGLFRITGFHVEVGDPLKRGAQLVIGACEIAWSITTQTVTEGELQRCNIHWQGNFGSVMQEKGDMAVVVFNADAFKANVADMNRVRRRNGSPDLAIIPGVGDEAYFFGYSEKGNPEARVGNLVVGIESLAGKPSLDLLRAALGRFH